MSFRRQIIDQLVASLKQNSEVRAVWEGGSAATLKLDEYSDIDLNILGEPTPIFLTIEQSLAAISPISHIWNEPKSFWPDLTQKIYFLQNSPKHFFVDVAVFPPSATQILAEFMQQERHGRPVVHFDLTGSIKRHPLDETGLALKRKKRLAELKEAFPVYRTNVFKALDRGNAIEAMSFFQAGMVRPLVEVLGMIHRPHRYDFGLRYLKDSFPTETIKKLESYLFIPNPEILRLRATEVEKQFIETTNQLQI